MKIEEKIAEAQKLLEQHHLDAWLLYDFHQSNFLAREFLEMPDTQMTSRRFFYFIPKNGSPIKIVHQIETNVLDHLPGDKLIYLHFKKLHQALKSILTNVKTCAMEYSPLNAIPTISKVDGGTVDLIRSFGPKVMSSGVFLQHFTCCLTEQQAQDHLSSAAFLDDTMNRAFDFMKKALLKGESITEYDVSEFVMKHFHANNYVTEHRPICAFNENSANPHYSPQKIGSKTLKKGDFVLLDMFAKKSHPQAIYTDITNIAYAGTSAPDKVQEVFNIVKKAKQDAIHFVATQVKNGQIVKGFEVDHVARNVIKESGYGEYFTHRTGHNIFKDLHGPGANIDGLETLDDRPLLPMTCFSVEPGIYLPGEFGVRLESSILLGSDKTLKVTCGKQEEIKYLLA